jgi:predicted O-methyltransferase YrrM
MQFKYNKLFLSNQFFFRKFFKKDKLLFEKKLYAYIEKFLKLIHPKKKFKLKISNRFSLEEMASPPLALNLYEFICNLSKPKKVLEIGTFVGVSALTLARATDNKCKIFTIEKFKEFFEIAKYNFKINKFDKKIKIYNGDAINILKKLKKFKFDLIFLDGDKGKYTEIFKIIEKNNIKKNSIIIVDNFFFHGDVLNRSPSDKGLGVKKLATYISKSKKYNLTLLPMYDGIALLQRK